MAFCTDDRDPEDIADQGHINQMVRKAVAAGVAPEDALVLASLNPRRRGTGSTISAPSRPAIRPISLVLPDLESFEPELVLKRGRPVEEIPRGASCPSG